MGSGRSEHCEAGVLSGRKHAGKHRCLLALDAAPLELDCEDLRLPSTSTAGPEALAAEVPATTAADSPLLPWTGNVLALEESVSGAGRRGESEVLLLRQGSARRPVKP